MNRAQARCVVATVVLSVATSGCCTFDQLLFDAMGPGAFRPELVPVAPDYTQFSAWAAHPEIEDASEVALENLPRTTTPQAAVFYVHPTTALSDQWNVATDDEDVKTNTERGGTLIQASVFNGCCVVYAPRYRQASGKAFVRGSEAGERAIAVALSDVERAFEAFLEATGQMPVILAGHSQGAVLLGRLLENPAHTKALQKRLVVAYLPGAPLRGRGGPLPTCKRATQVGCVASWNARGPGYVPNGFEIQSAADPRGHMCVNPISWEAPAVRSEGTGRKTTLKESKGAVFFDAPTPRLKEKFLTAQCKRGTLVVEDMGDLERDFLGSLLLLITGPENYHPVEYQMFYADLRHNATERVKAFVASQKTEQDEG